jgi:hypothetical protein
VADPLAIEFGSYRVTVAVDFGPRVLAFRRESGPELFASLGSDVVIDRPESGVYRFRGGHRLWASPEVPSITYAPDDEPCRVDLDGDSVAIEGPPDRAGLAKRMTLGSDGEGLEVIHALTNAGPRPFQLAPWAITQLRLGGTAIIPVSGEPDPEGLQADRSLVLWPYTDLADRRVMMRQRADVVVADPGPAFKIGTGPDPGRLGYLLDGHLFTKTVEPAGARPYPDRGAVAQFYLGDRFCEVETVGPLTTLEPGEGVTHREIWDIGPCEDVEAALTRLT